MSAPPESLRAAVRRSLRELGDASAIQSTRSVSGGCINHATRLETGKGAYLLKWNAEALPGMFQSEADGLALLAATGTVRVPAALAVMEATLDHPAYILLEFLEGSGPDDSGRLGEQLAALHRHGNPTAYGLEQDNYLGPTRQVNGWEADWAAFYARCRLLPQMEMGLRSGRVTPARRTLLERLIVRLPALLGGIERRPSLIHGDLWSGNVIPGPEGLALIDPAVYYADREAEIAYTELFNGFSPRFYEAYNAAWPLDSGYSERRDLLNLYHLLNHLNIFGESYGYHVDAVLRRYA